MAAVVDTDFIVVASSTSEEASSSKAITRPIAVALMPVGSHYLAHALRVTTQRTFDDEDKMIFEVEKRDLEEPGASNGVERDLDIGDEPESQELLASDPKRWKELDLYAVLGLSRFRYRATDEQIKIAHRKKVLKHHPDKKANSGDSNDDAFFKCIQKALEVLLDKERRRQFDSIDPYYLALEDQVPTIKDVQNARDPDNAFFRLFSNVFHREAHFCASHREDEVPRLGLPEATKAEVEGFYNFWYNFDSWRTFEWLDKEINEGSNNRDDKRYTEKKNKNERARRKKEDNQRLRELVDLALSLDPRIRRIKQEEKDERERKRQAKAGTAVQKPRTAREREEAAQRAMEEARIKAKQEEEEKIARMAEKKAKDAAKKKEKRAAKAAASQALEQ